MRYIYTFFVFILQSRHRGKTARRWFRNFLYNSWEWRIDPKTKQKYYRDRWKYKQHMDKPLLLQKWNIEPAEGLSELEVRLFIQIHQWKA